VSKALSHLDRKSIVAFLFPLLAATGAAAATTGDHIAQLREVDLKPLDALVRSEIELGRIPGAVIEIGQGERVVYRQAFGDREIGPRRVAMSPDTIFDLASLTKPVATAIAIMQLHERGRLELDAPAARYWPGFGRGGKQHITLRHLLTHQTGLRPDLDLTKRWTGYGTALKLIEAESPRHAPGTYYEYSDINFEVLGEIVRRVSRVPLEVYCRSHIFLPLGMTDTGFRPPAAVRDRIAPTSDASGKIRIGTVHDPTAARMGGVAGHAGLFSTADDLALLAKMLVGTGRSSGGVQILSFRSIDDMTRPESPDRAIHPRGLGWDLAAPLASNRDQLPLAGSYGHTGFTGTMLWVDPLSATYVIILTSRTYPHGTGDADPLRAKVLALVSDRLGPVSEAQVIADRPALAGFYAQTAARTPSAGPTDVTTGADVLVADDFAELKGARVGLITNQTGVTRRGVRDLDVFARASGLTLAAIFSPEHGLDGKADGPVASGTDPTTAVPVYSLYGDTMRPSDAMLEGLRALVFDIQDSGARFYTYVTTMAYAMEAAARHGIDFYVLDRPNPLSAAVVQGPVMDADRTSFTGYFPLPTRHGMTVGEMAEMFNRENHIGARLHVVRMHGYRRKDWYDETGLRWIAPSPNLRTLSEATLYPGVAMLEGANVSVGRGTDTPFEIVGAPWIDADRLATYLAGRGIPGIRFTSANFSPSADRYATRLCHGVNIALVDRTLLDAPALGIELIAALYRLYPEDFQLDSTLGMVGSRHVLEQIRAGEDPSAIVTTWQSSLETFRQLRSKYLLY
jgi:uncharacterized protein YbbC (DUF1343 family)/CubicO group peptidase (beta-lactamase class C family)